MKCPSCGEFYSVICEMEKIDDLYSSNLENNNSLNGLKSQIDSMIRDINTNIKKENIINQLKNFNIIINNIIENNNKNNVNIKYIKNKFSNNMENITNAELYNVKGKWKDFVAESLFNKQYESESKRIYNNILIKGAIVGNNGAYWAYSSNFDLQPYQFQNIKEIFNQKTNNSIKTLELGSEIYELLNYKQNISIDFKSGDIGGTIAKSNKAYIFGIFNSKIKYRLNGEERKQNLDLCNKVVEELAEALKSQNY